VGSHKEIDHYESQDVGRRIILKRTLEQYNGVVWTRHIWSRIPPIMGCCEHFNEPSNSIKFWDILGYLSNWLLLKEVSALWSLLVRNKEEIYILRTKSYI
jgi:hypothetical protein